MAALTLSAEVRYRNLPDAPDYLIGADGSAFVWKCYRYWRLKQTRRDNGYLVVKVRYPGGPRLRFVHHLVLEAFVGPCPEGMEACHYPDPDPTSNAISNLRWDTSASNKTDMLKHGTRARGERNGRSKLSDEDILEIRRLVAEGETKTAVARNFGVCPRTVDFVVKGRNWGHVGKRNEDGTDRTNARPTRDQ